ncbi:MAG: 30S ribosomal protein S20 [Planctomycetaceae bacterium]
MPNTTSAKKYLRQSSKRRIRNRANRSSLRTRLRNFRTFLDGEPSRADAEKQFDLVKKELDQAAAKNLIHTNSASRMKSRLSALKKKMCK